MYISNLVKGDLISFYTCSYVVVLWQVGLEYMTVMKGHVPHRGFKDYVTFLPQSLDVTDLMVPSRQIVHNWENQSYHNLCKGNVWCKEIV